MKDSLRKALNTEESTSRMALNFELPSDGSVPEWIELLPAGPIITGRDGRTWINDRPEAVVAAFLADGKDIPIDWEHATEIKAPNGEQAPAAGWIVELQVRDGGATWGRTEWTPRGKDSIAAREYRYLSPVFMFSIESNRILRITSCGLTNRPNLFLQAINHQQHGKETPMDLAQLLAALGLPATFTFAQALNHIAKMKEDYALALNQAQNPPVDKFVPRADYDAVVAKATNAENKLREQAAAELDKAINTEIDAALKAGKITPATKDYHVAQCRQEGGLERFKAFVAAAPTVAADSGLDGKKPEDGATALNAEEAKIAAMFGNSAEDIKKYGA